jgi:FKBP-type peptidyl-prolyl cis-trans isomerase
MKRYLPFLSILLACAGKQISSTAVDPAVQQDFGVVQTVPGGKSRATDSGLRYQVLAEGDGQRRPMPDSIVTVHYIGWTADGAQFDSSYERGQASTFPLDKVITGWTEGVQLMTTGGKTRFWIPEHLAYKGREGTPQGMLIFDVELIEIQ